jgi:hypothetical protein
MKKNKLLLLALTSLTVVTGCKGSKITAEEAKNVAENIAAESAKIYAEGNLSFTASASIEMTIEGEEGVMNTDIEYDAENKAMYAKIYTKDATTTVEMEYYCGFKDEVFYFFDEMKKEYYSVEGEAGKLTWAAQAENLAFPATTSTKIMGQLLVLINEENEYVKYYSSGEGNLYVECEYEEEGEKGSFVYEFKDNLVTKEIINASDSEGNKMKSETTLKYKASVKLPSESGYEKKSLLG